MTGYSSDADYLIAQLRERVEETEKFLSMGQAKDYAEYRHLCGLVRGLEAAEQMIKDLAKRREQDADE